LQKKKKLVDLANTYAWRLWNSDYQTLWQKPMLTWTKNVEFEHL
jgi:hypothetical protein